MYIPFSLSVTGLDTDGVYLNNNLFPKALPSPEKWAGALVYKTSHKPYVPGKQVCSDHVTVCNVFLLTYSVKKEPYSSNTHTQKKNQSSVQ